MLTPQEMTERNAIIMRAFDDMQHENKRLRELLEYAIVATTGDPQNCIGALWLVPIANEISWKHWLEESRRALFPEDFRKPVVGGPAAQRENENA